MTQGLQLALCAFDRWSFTVFDTVANGSHVGSDDHSQCGFAGNRDFVQRVERISHKKLENFWGDAHHEQRNAYKMLHKCLKVTILLFVIKQLKLKNTKNAIIN